MGPTLTIVARRPSYHGNQDTDAAIDEQDQAISDVMDTLRARANKATNHVMRASTVEQIRSAITTYQGKHGAAPAQLQLIGHGMSGALSIGAAWGPPAPNATETYILDSNPDDYGILYEVVAPTTTVYLLGCTIGEVGITTNAIPDGPVLLFDLARMWGAAVSAPTSTIDATNFDANGLFTPANSLATAQGLSVTMPASAPPSNMSPKHGASARFRFLRCTGAPGLGVWSPHVTEDKLAALSQLDFQPAQGPALLAIAEVSFAITWNGAAATADVIVNGRWLRVRSGSSTDYFQIAPTTRPLLAQIMADVVASQ